MNVTPSPSQSALRKALKSTLPGVWAGLSAAKRAALNARPARHVFGKLYRHNGWGDPESVSGPGSNLEQTVTVRRVLPDLLCRLDVRTLLDVPCGDWYWMREVDLGTVAYIGGDIVRDIVEQDAAQYTGRGEFRVLDLAVDPLPDADVLLCRDCLVHLPLRTIQKCISNIKQSGVTYLLTTTFLHVLSNEDIPIGDWRPLNLQLAPFHFPAPLEVHEEREAPDDGAGKSLALWRVADLPGSAAALPQGAAQ